MTNKNKRFVSFVVLSFVSFVVALTSAQEQMPRFRAGTNLVRVDAYVSKDDVAVTDLKAEDFEVFEDDKPQKIENFELITARRPNPQTERIDPTNVRDMDQQVTDRRAGVHALLRSLAGVAVRLVSRPEADHRDARSRHRPG